MPMKMSRRQDDGAQDKMSPFKRINTEFGAWKSTTNTLSSNMMSREEQEDYVNPNAALTPPPAPSPSIASTTTRPCKFFNPRAIPRYSQMDMFIEGLDAACEALPTPLVGGTSVGAPSPLLRATSMKDCSSAQQHLHPQPQHRSLSQTGGIVKEVKFADEVIEIGESASGCSAKSAREVKEPLAKKMAECGARSSRAMRFDYKKRRSDYVKAATIVQSTYRGYKVRRGQPLKYLLAISSVKEKLEELRQQFDAWKIAAWFPTDLTERTSMTESVMDLLVQLDSLQGVPVVVREFRKTVARDVIKFQEEVDGFLCRNSKHGVLFDLTRQEGKAPQGSSILKPSKTIRNIVVHESNFIENGRNSNPMLCTVEFNGSCKEEVKDGTMTSIDVTSEFRSDRQNKNTEVPFYLVRPPSRSGQDFVLWSPEDAEFEKLRVREKTSGEKQPESVTQLKKCVASTDALDIYMPPDRKRKSLGSRLNIVHSGSKSFGKEHISITNECPQAPLDDASLRKSTSVEFLKQDVPHPCDVSSLDFTGYCQKKEDSKVKVSINTERSLDTNANGKIHIPKDFKITNVHENLEDRTITNLHRVVQPDFYSSRKKWEDEFPSDVHCKVHQSLEEDQAIGHSHILVQPDYSLREKWEAEFPAPVHCDTFFDEDCNDMEDTPTFMFEPPIEKNKDPHTPVEVVTSKDLYDDGFRHNWTNFHAFPCRVEYVSMIDVREGTTEPLLANDQKNKDMYDPITSLQLDCSSTNTFPYFDDEDGYIDSSHALLEVNKIGLSQDKSDSLAKESDPCNVVFSEEEQQKLGVHGGEAIMIGQSALPKNSENASLLIPSPGILQANIGEQLDREPGSEYEPCCFDDLETISSCSNCAACPVDSIGEPWEFDSGVRLQMSRQPSALKGLDREPDEVFAERKGEDTRCFEAGYWKDQAWKDLPPTKFQPYNYGTDNSLPYFKREVEVQRENELQHFQEIEQKLLAEAQLASLHEEDHPEMNKATNLESEPSKLACTSQSLGQEGVASGSTTVVSPEGKGDLLLTKLVEDNKRLKELLKEVMKWNTVQANAMITLNERLELVESKK